MFCVGLFFRRRLIITIYLGLIDELLKSITEEFNITTIINTHDMKTVFDIGDDVIFIYQGMNEWSGKVRDIHSSNNEMLTNFIKASYFD